MLSCFHRRRWESDNHSSAHRRYPILAFSRRPAKPMPLRGGCLGRYHNWVTPSGSRNLWATAVSSFTENFEQGLVCKIEKPAGQFAYNYMFIVTNMALPVKDVIRLYCQRGIMENFIKEGKSGFDFGAVSSATMKVNANRLALHMLAYNLFNWFRRLVLPKAMQKLRVDALRLKLLRIAARVVRSGRYLLFRLCSSCPYQREFRQTLSNIRALPV